MTMTITNISRSSQTSLVYFDLVRDTGVLYLAVLDTEKPEDLWTLERLSRGSRPMLFWVRKRLSRKAWSEALTAITSHLKEA